MQQFKRVRMTTRHDSLDANEEVNLPTVLADSLVGEGKAEHVVREPAPEQNKAVTPRENKAAEKPSKK